MSATDSMRGGDIRRALSGPDDDVVYQPPDPVVTEVGTPVDDQPEQSGWDVLAEEYEQIGDAETANDHWRLTLDVYRGRRYTVAARYRWVSPTVTERIGQAAARMKPGTDQTLYVACHTLAACCDEVGFLGPDGKLVSHPAGPARFDARLAKALHVKLSDDADTDRVMQTVVGAFGHNEWAVMAQAREVDMFLVDPTRGVNEAYLGGSQGTR